MRSGLFIAHTEAIIAKRTRTPQAFPVSIPLAQSIGADAANEWISRDDHTSNCLVSWRAKSYIGFLARIQTQDDFLSVLQAWEKGFDNATSAADATLVRPAPDAADIHAAALSDAIDAVDIAKLGLDGLDELRTILRAIWKLAAHDDIILGLAHVGVTRASEWHDLIRSQHERAVVELAVLQGASSHV